MNNSLVNVIIPAYNAESSIKRAIESVLQSNRDGLQVIVIDDCSTDRTNLVCRKINDERLILITNKKNHGVSYSRNIGLRFKSDYVAFLDADDFWYSDKLDSQIKILESTSNDILGCYSNIVFNGKQIKEAPSSISYNSLLLNGNEIGLSSTLIKKASINNLYFEKIGHEDYKFWLDLLANGGSLLLSSKSNDINQMTYYQKSKFSLSGNKFKSAIWTFKVLYSVVPLFYAFYYFFRYIFKHLKRSLK